MLTLILALAAQAAPQQGPIKTFGDWAVACDNVKRCEATSLLPEDADAGEPSVALSVVREPGPQGAWHVAIDAPEKTAVRLSIAGGGPAGAAAGWQGAEFDGGDALAIVESMVNGSAATVTDTAGKPLGRVSLKGSAAAFRFIDAEQGRAGTVTAAAAKGAKPATAVPAALPLPRIAYSSPGGTPAPLTAELTRNLWEQSQCGENYEAGQLPEIEIHALGGGRTLALVPCGAGAYNFSSAAFVIEGGKAVPAAYDAPPGWMPEGEGPALLVNAGFDAKTGQLTSFAKGRGIGDCGNLESYVFDGARFRLIEARLMGECRGSVNWLAVWRAEATAR